MNREEIFIEPIDLDPDIAVGIMLPFNNSKGGAFQLSYTTEQQAISNLKNLILTRKGERYMQPEFGTDIYSLLFEQNTEEFSSRLQNRLSADIGYWLPYIVIINISVQSYLDSEIERFGNGIKISLKFKVTEQGAGKEIVLFVNEQSNISIQENI